MTPEEIRRRQHAGERTIDIDATIAEVTNARGLVESDVRSPLRHAELVRARDEIAYRLYCETTLSYPAIGRALGRDHASIIDGVRRHAMLVGDATYASPKHTKLLKRALASTRAA